MEFGEPREELGAVADGQLGQFFKDLSFAHGVNLARSGFSRKRGVSGETMKEEVLANNSKAAGAVRRRFC